MKLAIILGSVLLASQALAYDSRGFMTGGGVGSETCPVFIDAMATARQQGGLTSRGGIAVINPFVQYVAGFQTGYNRAAEGVCNVFEPLGENPINSVLIMIEVWCSKEPTTTFDTGLLDLLKTLQKAAREK